MANNTTKIRITSRDSNYRILSKGDSKYKITSKNTQGPSGISAYQEALNNGFVGTSEEWLVSLEGETAYEVALNNGFVGTEAEWLYHLNSNIRAEPQNEGKILSNDGTDFVWETIEQKLNTQAIVWDLGSIEE
jgi:hypothetical protein